MKKLFCLTLVLTMLAAIICGCSNKELEILPGKRMELTYNKSDYAIMSADWPYYNTPEELVDAAYYIYKGKVKEISFQIVDLYSGSTELTSESYPMLETVYTIEVTEAYKGIENDTAYLRIMGGIPTYKEDEQLRLCGEDPRVSKHLKQYYGNGIPVMIEHSPLAVGETYLFCTSKKMEPYSGIMNPEQSVMSVSCSFAKEVIRKAK